MPWGGYIKRFVLEDTGFKFSSDKHTNLTNFSRSLDNVKLPIFMLVVVKMTREVIDIGNLFMHFVFFNKELVVEHVFISGVPGGEPEKYKIKEKDKLNIRSEINTANLPGRYRYTGGKQRVGYLVTDTVNEFFTYLVTILIELDPF